MKATIYIETTVVSYLVARPSRDLITAALQRMTQEWWESRYNDYDLHYSQLVWDEAMGGDKTEAAKRSAALVALSLLPARTEVDDLADAIMAAGLLPKNAAADAMHIAFAAVYGMDYLLTWNCRHINNIDRLGQIAEICIKKGYKCPKICLPEQMSGLDS